MTPLKKTVPDAYSMHLIQKIFESMEDAACFNILDLQPGYWQVEVEDKTAFITTTGLHQFHSMLYGLKNAAATFQRLIEKILEELRGQFCFIYIDHIIIFPSMSEHITHLSIILQILTQANLTLNLKKWHFFKRELKFLSQLISEKGVEVDAEKPKLLFSIPLPFQGFLGLAGWYHKFIPYFAYITAPLNNLKKINVKWQWTLECQANSTPSSCLFRIHPFLCNLTSTSHFRCTQMTVMWAWVPLSASKHLKERGS